MIAMEMGTIELLRLGAGTAIPENSVNLIGSQVPATALITDTAGVNKPSAITQLAPNRVHKSNPILKILFSRIQAPLTARPLKSVVESIVSETVSISESL